MNRDRDALKANLANFWWWHHWEVEPGVFTPGVSDCELLLNRLGLPLDLSDLSVLDVGAYDGAVSFVCERRGAKRVVAQDMQIRHTIRFLHEYLHSNVEFFECSVYELDPATIGQFDIVIFSGVLYHMRYPLLAIDRVRGVAKDRVYVESHCPEIAVPDSAPSCFAFPLFFYESNELNGDYSNWHGPTAPTVMAMFRSAGFAIEQYSQWCDRVVFHARVQPGARPFLVNDFSSHVSYSGLHELTPEEDSLQRSRRIDKW